MLVYIIFAVCFPSLCPRKVNHIIYFFFGQCFFFFLNTIETSSTGAAFKDILKHENNHITASSAAGEKLLGYFCIEQCGKKSLHDRKFSCHGAFELTWQFDLLDYSQVLFASKYPHHKQALQKQRLLFMVLSLIFCYHRMSIRIQEKQTKKHQEQQETKSFQTQRLQSPGKPANIL